MLILLQFMHHIALGTSCIARFIVCHLLAYTIDHVEPEFEGTPEHVQAEDANPELEQGKHRCIQTPILDSCLIFVA
jgi:hypothetical protein